MIIKPEGAHVACAGTRVELEDPAALATYLFGAESIGSAAAYDSAMAAAKPKLRQLWLNLADAAGQTVKSRNWRNLRNAVASVKLRQHGVAVTLDTADLRSPCYVLTANSAIGSGSVKYACLKDRKLLDAVLPRAATGLFIATPFTQGLSIAFQMAEAALTASAAAKTSEGYQKVIDDLSDQLDSLTDYANASLFTASDGLGMVLVSGTPALITAVVGGEALGTPQLVPGNQIAALAGTVDTYASDWVQAIAAKTGSTIAQNGIPADMLDELFSANVWWSLIDVSTKPSLSLTTKETEWLLSAPEEVFSQLQALTQFVSSSAVMTTSQMWNMASLLDRAVKRINAVAPDEDLAIAKHPKSLDIYSWVSMFAPTLSVNQMRAALALARSRVTVEVVTDPTSTAGYRLASALGRQVAVPGYDLLAFLPKYANNVPHAFTPNASEGTLTLTINAGNSVAGLGAYAITFSGFGASQYVLDSSYNDANYRAIMITAVNLFQRIQFLLELASGTNEVSYSIPEGSTTGVLTVYPKMAAALMSVSPSVISPSVAVVSSFI